MGLKHPLTPYYRQKSKAAKLPVHPGPGGISYRLWPGLVSGTTDRLRNPAQTVRHWWERAWQLDLTASIVAYGYDMDNMKARAWVEGEVPLWRFRDAGVQEECEYCAERVTAAASNAAGLLTSAVKSARYDRPKDHARGNYGFIRGTFFSRDGSRVLRGSGQRRDLDSGARGHGGSHAD